MDHVDPRLKGLIVVGAVTEIIFQGAILQLVREVIGLFRDGSQVGEAVAVPAEGQVSLAMKPGSQLIAGLHIGDQAAVAHDGAAAGAELIMTLVGHGRNTVKRGEAVGHLSCHIVERGNTLRDIGIGHFADEPVGIGAASSGRQGEFFLFSQGTVQGQPGIDDSHTSREPHGLGVTILEVDFHH